MLLKELCMRSKRSVRVYVCVCETPFWHKESETNDGRKFEQPYGVQYDSHKITHLTNAS